MKSRYYPAYAYTVAGIILVAVGLIFTKDQLVWVLGGVVSLGVVFHIWYRIKKGRWMTIDDVPN